MTGILYIVATPIGNLADITLRAIETLKSMDYVLCEDTRVSGKLFKHYVIDNRLVSFNDFNEDRKTPEVIADLLAGKSVALISDAGTPLISDPGYKLVREAVAKGICIESIPGPSTVITALTLSALPPDKFLFLGYLPKKDGKRRESLIKIKELIQKIKSTVIIYESPYRLVKTLKHIREIFGDIEIVICRELTKMHEEVRREKISESMDYFSNNKPKGEFVILF